MNKEYFERIKKELTGMRTEYDRIQSYDYARELDELDSLSIEQGNSTLKNYIRRQTSMLMKAAERYAMDKLYPVEAGEKRRNSAKKQIKQSGEYEGLVNEYLNDHPEYARLQASGCPGDLTEEERLELHDNYIEKNRKSDLDGVLWNAEYVIGQLANGIDITGMISRHMPEMKKALKESIDNYFLTITTDEFYIYKNADDRGDADSAALNQNAYGKGGYSRRRRSIRERVHLTVSDETWEDFGESFMNFKGSLEKSRVWNEICESYDSADFITKYLGQHDGELGELKALIGPLDGYGTFEEAMVDRICADVYSRGKLEHIIEEYDSDRVLDLLSRNEHYAWIIYKRYEEREKNRRLKLGLLDAIPATYPELFPLARAIHRHFILHIGPTNSGKSHDAIEALKLAERGIYLAPLRLLAYEKYEEFMEAEVPCSMVTGEEEIVTPFARIQSSTIEILNFQNEYDIAVIDEGQMVADPQRGSAWTMAILGVRSPVVHICLAPEAEDVIKGMIEACSDTYEVVRHERLVPLKYKKESDDIFPRNAQRGDAFIVFSRRDVHACAAELKDNGINCSMIYGNLPYDVRRKEVKRYIAGETDVIVATDAIGMGLNLPIRRIIFLRTEKFDGVTKRELEPQEVKQIAGRAGRYGMFDLGIVSADVGKKMISVMLNEPPVPIDKAVIGFPYSLTHVQGSLSYLLKEWCRMKPLPGFEMADMSDQISLAEELENYTADKELIFRFVMIPFDIENEQLHGLWLELFMYARDGKKADVHEMIPQGSIVLEELERNFKACDILYHYSRDFLQGEFDSEILQAKNTISAQIMHILSVQAPEYRTCRYCGRKLPFRYPYNICEKCHKKKKYD